MNMKRFLLAACLVGALSGLADELQYLYWQVDLDSVNPYSAPAFSYATLSDDGGVSYLSFYGTGGSAIGTEMAVSTWDNVGDTGTKAGPLYSGFDASVLSGSFLFELWQEDAQGTASRVGWASYSYAQLQDHIYKSVAQGAGNDPLTIAAVPEPSSALLLILGMAGLALRRRKA